MRGFLSQSTEVAALTDPSSTLSDRDLVAAIRHGRNAEQAFARLVERYLPLIMGYLRARGIPLPDAEDLAQETFLRILEHLPRYSEQGRFSGWVVTIARGILVDRIRQQKREQNLWQELDRDPVLPTTTKVGGSDIDGFIASLAPADRLLLELRIFQEWSFQEIAEHLEEREGTVRVRFHRLLHRLRNRLVAAESDNA